MVKEIQKKNKNKKNIKNQYIYTGCQIINKTLFDKFLSKNFWGILGGCVVRAFLSKKNLNFLEIYIRKHQINKNVETNWESSYYDFFYSDICKRRIF